MALARRPPVSLCHKAGIDPQVRARDLGEDEVARLAALLDKDYVVEGQLRRQTSQNISRLRDIGCYRGFAASSRPAGTRSTYQNQCPYPQRTEKDGCWEEGRERFKVIVTSFELRVFFCTQPKNSKTPNPNSKLPTRNAELLVAKDNKKSKAKKKTVRRNVTVAIAHISATFNNTQVDDHRHKGRYVCAGQVLALRDLRAAVRVRLLRDKALPNRQPKRRVSFGVKDVPGPK